MYLIEFTDGSSTTELVGKKSAFKDATDFLEKCRGEFDWILDELKFEINAEQVIDGLYSRFYRNMPSDYAYLDLESGYTFCDKGRGAFEVYVLPIRILKQKHAFMETLREASPETTASPNEVAAV